MDITRITGRYLHISYSTGITVLKTGIPSNSVGRPTEYYMEDNVTERISLAPSIRDCLLGLQISDFDIMDGKVYKSIPIRNNLPVHGGY